MRTTTIILWGIAAALVGFTYFKQHALAARGMRISGVMLVRMGPMLLAAFIIAGYLQALLPRDLVTNWLGQKAGIKAILVACLAGALTPGGPYVSLPIAVALFRAGADMGCVVAYLVAWTMWGVHGLAFEFAVMGPPLTLAKRLATLPFPILAGLAVQAAAALRT